jgi:hypothetical protein
MSDVVYAVSQAAIEHNEQKKVTDGRYRRVAPR